MSPTQLMAARTSRLCNTTWRLTATSTSSRMSATHGCHPSGKAFVMRLGDVGSSDARDLENHVGAIGLRRRLEAYRRRAAERFRGEMHGGLRGEGIAARASEPRLDAASVRGDGLAPQEAR